MINMTYLHSKQPVRFYSWIVGMNDCYHQFNHKALLGQYYLLWRRYPTIVLL